MTLVDEDTVMLCNKKCIAADINDQKLAAFAGDAVAFYGVDWKGGSNEREVHKPNSAERPAPGQRGDEDLVVRGKFTSSLIFIIMMPYMYTACIQATHLCKHFQRLLLLTIQLCCITYTCMLVACQQT